MLERCVVALESVTWSCPKHGTFHMARTFIGGKLLQHVGDVFPCRCWYELKDEYYGNAWEQGYPNDGHGPIESWQRELFPNSQDTPLGGSEG